MDFGTMKERVRRRAGLPAGDAALQDLDGAVNEGLRMFETSNPNGWPWLRRVGSTSTAASDGDITFGALGTAIGTGIEVVKIISARLQIVGGARQADLQRLSLDEADDLYPDIGSPGEPQVIAIDGSTLYLRPVPSGIYTLRFHAVIAEPELVADDQYPLTPAPFRPAIVAAALALIYQDVQNAPAAQAAEQRFAGHVARARSYARQYVGAGRVRAQDR